MHLVEALSLCCGGAKIGLPFMQEEPYPLEIDRYITFNPQGKNINRKYDYWNQVFEILLPKLNEAGIKIIHLGDESEENYDGLIRLCGKTSIKNLPYIIGRGLLHLGVDSFPTHIASWKQKKIVFLYATTYLSVVKPYWSKRQDVISLGPDFIDKKPSFCFDEIPKRINQISPQEIASSVLKLLKPDSKYEYLKGIDGLPANSVAECKDLISEGLIDVEGGFISLTRLAQSRQ